MNRFKFLQLILYSHPKRITQSPMLSEGTYSCPLLPSQAVMVKSNSPSFQWKLMRAFGLLKNQSRCKATKYSLPLPPASISITMYMSPSTSTERPLSYRSQGPMTKSMTPFPTLEAYLGLFLYFWLSLLAPIVKFATSYIRALKYL